MDVIHRLIAYAAIGGGAVGIGWSVLILVSGRSGGPAFERFQAAMVSLLLIGAASGVILLVAGARPTDALHLLYAAIAIGLVPLARSFLGRLSDRRTAAAILVAFVALGAVIYRLFTTG
ncbi:MAG: hypothetical protein WEE67_08620 [Chloroflexota bacterium]